MRSVLVACGAGLLLLAASAGPARAQEPALVETTQSTGPQRGAACEAEAARRGLTGLQRTAFLADCTKLRLAPQPGVGPSAAPEKKRLRRTRQECRDYAAKIRRLWGLARHKFVQRCRAGRNIAGVPALR